MKKIVPSYYDSFQCIASACQDSCCIGWEIDIDERTLQRYKKAEKERGLSILKHIHQGEEGAHMVLKEDGRCPFLNEDNLCEIYIQLGEDALSHICQCHPRFIKNFGSWEEYGLDLCCEEAARIVLSQEALPSFEVCDIQEAKMEPQEGFSQEICEEMVECRQQMFAYIGTTKDSLNSVIGRLLAYCEGNLEDLCQETGEAWEKEYIEADPDKGYYRELLEFFRGLAPLSVRWHNFLAEVADDFDAIYEVKDEFHRQYPRFQWEAKLLLHHYIYRYFLDGVWEEDYYSATFLAVTMVRMIELLDVAWFYIQKKFSLEDQIYICCQMSKEIEYSEENVEALYDKSWEM